MQRLRDRKDNLRRDHLVLRIVSYEDNKRDDVIESDRSGGSDRSFK